MSVSKQPLVEIAFVYELGFWGWWSTSTPDHILSIV